MKRTAKAAKEEAKSAIHRAAFSDIPGKRDMAYAALDTALRLARKEARERERKRAYADGYNACYKEYNLRYRNPNVDPTKDTP